MKYSQFKRTLINIVMKNTSHWTISSNKNKFYIIFNNRNDEENTDISIWSNESDFNKDFFIQSNIDNIFRSYRFEDIFKIYPVEVFNHRYGIQFELKNGCSFVIGR